MSLLAPPAPPARAGAALASLALSHRQKGVPAPLAQPMAYLISAGCLPSSLTSLRLDHVWFNATEDQAWQGVALPGLQQLDLSLVGASHLTSPVGTAFSRWAGHWLRPRRHAGSSQLLIM